MHLWADVYSVYADLVRATAYGNLIAYWPLWDAAGSSAVDDISGHDRDGTPTSVTLGQPGIGDGETCGEFDGTNSYVNIYSDGLGDDLNGDEGTILLWAASPDGYHGGGGTQTLLRIGDSTNDQVLILSDDAGNVVVQRHAGGAAKQASSAALDGDLGFNCIVFTWSKAGDEIALVINGTEVDTANTLAAWTGSGLSNTLCWLGVYLVGPSLPWKGTLAHVAVWNTVLSTPQITALSTVLQAPGPLVNLSRVSVTRRLDGAGEIALSMLASDKRVQDLIANERRVAIYTRAPFERETATLGSTVSSQLGIGTSGSEVRWKAQSFTMPFDGYLLGFMVSFGSNVGTPTGTVTYELRADNGGEPDSTVLLSGTFTVTPSAENTVTVPPACRLAPGVTYWLVLRPTTPQSDPDQWRPYWTSDGAGEYAYGQASFSTDGGSTWTGNGRDVIGTLTFGSITEDIEPIRELGRGIMRQIKGQEDANNAIITLTGPDILNELINVNCLLERVYDGSNVTSIVSDLIGLAPGWSVDTTGVTGTAYARFDGTSVLKALQELAKFKGYHLRLTGNRSLKFGPLGDDSGIRIIQAGSQITPALEAEASVFLIEKLRWVHDSEAIANWIVPVGRSRDETALTLQYSTRGGLTSNIVYDDDNADAVVLLQGPHGQTTSTTITATGTSYVIGNSSGNDYWVAQSFQVTAGKLAQIQITLSTSLFNPVGRIIWQVYTDSSGAPGTLLDEGSFVPIDSAVNTITVVGGPSLSASTTYWLVLKPSQKQNDNTWWSWQAQASSTYANGELKYSTDGGTTWNTTGYDADCVITTGSTTANSQIAQSFVADGTAIPKVDLWLSKVGSPGDTLTLEMQPDSGGSPSGVAMPGGISGGVETAIVSTDAERATFCFTAEPAPINGNTYWLVLKTDGSQDNSNYVRWHADTTSPGFASGVMKSYNGSWYAESKDACFDIFERATHSDPYDLLVKPGAQGRAMYYLKDATSIRTYGQIERVFTVDITPSSEDAADVVTAANAIYDAAAVWLERYATRQTVYAVDVRKGYQTIYPGQTVKLVYKGYVYDDDGNKISWLDIDADFWVTRVTETVTAKGLTMSLELSNVERAHDDIARQLVSALERVELNTAAPRAYSKVDNTTATEFVQGYFGTLYE